MRNKKASATSWIMISGTISVLMISLTACTTVHYDRAAPVSPSERSSLTCEQIEIEIENAELFVSDIQEQRLETTGAHVVGALLDAGIGNVMEGDAAEASGTDRISQLKELQSEKGCP